MKKPAVKKAADPTWLTAVRAAEEKKAIDIKVLDLTGISSFTDFFVICTGSSSKQNQAISDEVAFRMKKAGELPLSVEGYSTAEWILTDYGDLVVHSLTPEGSRLLRSGTALARRQRGSDSGGSTRRSEGQTRRQNRQIGLKVFLYYIGKPKDAHANALAAEYIKRTGHYAASVMAEIRPERTGSVGEASDREKDPAGSRRKTT